MANRNDLRRDEHRIEAERKESELRARISIVRRDLDGALLAKRIAQVRAQSIFLTFPFFCPR